MIKIIRKKPRKLDLSGKKLDAFPADVFKDKKITCLNLSDNRIKEIPANICELTDLRFLHLENNEITQLHNGILKAKSLRHLYLEGNPMKDLPDFIKENAKFNISTNNGVHRYYPKVEINGSNEKLQEELGQEVNNIITHKTIFEDSRAVPTIMDSALTFRRHNDRKGKSINTCVLFVDIRDSVQKNKDHLATTLADMYSSFVYGVLRISREYKGHVRNIIGDRVMVVFDEEDCCDNAVKCAGSIMFFCKTKMKRTLPNDTFRCGIGIHYGNMKVIKVGLEVENNENADYKNLVWIGEPVNLASRLTDKAGKENLPPVVVSNDVFRELKDDMLIRNFMFVEKRKFKDVEFNVYGCNLFIK